ncbi:hypothetical protein [Altererythrobacter lutimaris]|uniref:Uncharacterized protein n=1 Tax=Altererythrobacter lutimaris TaxID=2743979 RepID=A0A850HAT6_9SPHN|nr:hypothetical protein [Altererythrobacter lutimaris]NVE95133.1 hypothetical protein [Altererythrobacter lutimaris]
MSDGGAVSPDALKWLDPWLSKAKDLFVLIPALHIFCCFVYLFFYYYSFGNGLIYFASPTEVFSVSLAEVAPLYLFGGLGLIIGAWSYQTDDQIESRHSKAGARVAKGLKYSQHAFVGLLALALLVVGAVSSMIEGYIFWFLMIFPLVLLFASSLSAFAVHKGLTVNAIMPIFWLSFAFISVSLNGLEDGQYASLVRVELDSISGPRCHEKVILKDDADSFLAVDKDNNRLIVDKECATKFKVIDGTESRKIELNPFAVIAKSFSD